MESENDIIRDRAKFLAKGSKPSELPCIALLILFDLRLPLNYLGFAYLKQILPIASKEPTEIVLKEIYQEVGNRYNPEVGYATMDGAVHDVIVKGWENGNREKWQYYFPSHVIEGPEPPCNSEFISGIAYFLEMWLKYSKEGEYAKQ